MEEVTNLDAFAVLTRYSLIIKQIPKMNDQETFSRMDFETGYALQHEKQKVLRFIDKAVENKLNFIAMMFSPPNKINASFNIRNVAIVAGSLSRLKAYRGKHKTRCYTQSKT